MVRTACGFAFLLFLPVPGQAQRSPGTTSRERQTSQTSAASEVPQWDWLMLTGTRAASNAAGAPGAPGGTVSVDALRVPPAAVREMQQFQKDYSGGKLADSAKHLQKAIRIYPQWAAAHQNLGQTYARMRWYEKAIPEFESAASLDPRAARPWASLAALHFLEKQYAPSEQAARRALDLDPADDQARYILGRTLLAEGHDSEQAVELLKKTRQAYPAARLMLANEYLKHHAVEEAKSELRDYLLQPDAPAKQKVQCMLDRLGPDGETANCSMQ
jgi:tetratricopeptide (TPR) repeat protein